MKYRLNAESGLAKTLLASLAMLLLVPVASMAQVPVDENGEVIGDYEVQGSEPAIGNEDIPLLSTVDLEELVGPIALYPDDLLAIVLPAAAYPLQIVDAARFLKALENDASLKPDPEWDDSVVALINYPEVVELLNEDIDWTWRLGEAVVSQQADVVGAIETFRDRAYAAGNLKSDSYQNVSRDEGVIEITPVAEDVIYVPYYEPERVVVYQPRPVYYYYPRPYPVYYYPYSSAHAFNRGYFWGVTTAYTIGWFSDSLHVYHHSYHGHPYYGHSYWDRWWYRRPTLGFHNSIYTGGNTNITINRYYGGDRWRPRHDRRNYVSNGRVTRNREYAGTHAGSSTNNVQRINTPRQTARNDVRRNGQRPETREPIAFRDRPQTTATNRRGRTDGQQQTTRVSPRNSDSSDRRRPTERDDARRRDEPIAFRDRPQSTATNRRGGTQREQQTARVNPRSNDSASRTRPETTQRRHEQPREQRHESRERRTIQTANSHRSAPTAQLRRPEPARESRRAEPRSQERRTAPTRESQRAQPQRAQAQRQERSAQKSAPAAKTRNDSGRKSERRSGRR